MDKDASRKNQEVTDEIIKVRTKEVPGHLQHIYKPPPHIYVRKLRGTALPRMKKYITIVGPRKPSGYARTVCQQIIEELRYYSVCIVSGLAYGIDALAHEHALKNNIPCIAFPGSGIEDDVLYPRHNYMLAQSILESGGALMCQWHTSLRAATWTFPARNRLMSGIADAVIIIEADEHSGTLITARYALAEGRDVFVIPADITRLEALGSNSLIQHGAHPIISISELPELLKLSPLKKIEQSNLDIKRSPSYTTDSLAQKILTSLSSPKNTSQLSLELNVDISTLITQLQDLELDDMVMKKGSLWCRK